MSFINELKQAQWKRDIDRFMFNRVAYLRLRSLMSANQFHNIRARHRCRSIMIEIQAKYPTHIKLSEIPGD